MPNMSEESVDCDQLDAAVEEAAERFEKLRAKHGEELKAYLVLCHGAEQARLTSNALDVLTSCPKVVVDNAAKRDVKKLLSELSQLRSKRVNHAELTRISGALDARTCHLRFLSAAQIELRFDDLQYRLVHTLRTDPLIDQALTPQHGPSIRVVLGSLGSLI